MGTKALWIGGLVAAAGLGFLGGGATEGFGLFAPADRAPAPSPGGGARAVAAAPPAADDAPPALSRAGPGGDAGVAALRDENVRLAARVATLERDLASTREAAASARRASAPVFTFGEMGALPAVREADWKDLSEASKRVNDAIVEIFRIKERGEEVPKELHRTLQENVERVRRYEYRTIDRMPTAAKHNGELTHPISLANLLAGVLAAEGVPLTEAQVAEVERLGLAFDEEFVRLRGGWTEDKPRVRRMLEEYRAKGAFTESLWNALTPEQRVHWVDPALRGLAGLDLFDPTLMILHTTAVVTGADAAEIRPKLLALLRPKVGLAPDAPSPRLEAHVETFLAHAMRGARPVPKVRAKHYSFAEGLVAGEASVALVEALLRDLDLPEAARRSLADDYAWYLPRPVL
jgi:hypothetical protein